jgi:hypothetical protein
MTDRPAQGKRVRRKGVPFPSKLRASGMTGVLVAACTIAKTRWKIRTLKGEGCGTPIQIIRGDQGSGASRNGTAAAGRPGAVFML